MYPCNLFTFECLSISLSLLLNKVLKMHSGKLYCGGNCHSGLGYRLYPGAGMDLREHLGHLLILQIRKFRIREGKRQW